MDTVRSRHTQIPLTTRSSDVRAMAQCPGSFLLRNLYQPELAETVFFRLGLDVHAGIQRAVTLGWDLDRTTAWVTDRLGNWKAGLADPGKVLESARRSLDTVTEDAADLIGNWFRFVHKDSADRHPLYDDYSWPPKVEVRFQRADLGTVYPVWGTVDAVFTGTRGTLIADWKCSVRPQKDDLQLQFYRLGLDSRDARAVFHYLNRTRAKDMVAEADPYPGDRKLLAMIARTESQKEQMLDTGYPWFKPSRLCSVCPARNLCPEALHFERRYNDRELAKKRIRLDLNKAEKLAVVM